MRYYIGNNIVPYKGYTDSTIEECFNYCKTKKILGVDIETSRKFKKGSVSEVKYKAGLDPFLSIICMLQIGDLDNQFVIDARVTDLRILIPILESKKILKVGHNLKFEFKHLFVLLGCKLENIWDTMICEKILYNGERISFSLEALSYRHLDSKRVIFEPSLFENDDEEEEEELEFRNEFDWIDRSFSFKVDKSVRMEFVEIGSSPFTQQQLNYACDDILMPLLIQQKQVQGRTINSELYKPDIAFRVENKFCTTLGFIELKGVRVSVPGWIELFEKNMKERKRIKALLDAHILEHFKEYESPPNLFGYDPTCTLDWESSTQVVKLFKKLGICPKEFSMQTKKVEYTVGAKALSKRLTNANKDNFFKAKLIPFTGKEDYQALMLNYLIYKKFQLFTTTFGMDWLEYIHPITKRVYSNFKQLMNTGRMASVSPNLQQLPKGKEWRALFICDDGHKLTAVDYDTQEVKVAAIVHNEQNLKDFFVKKHPIHGTDYHSYTATRMFSLMRKEPDLILTGENKKERNTAKSISFKVFYGGSAFTLSEDLGITLEEAEAFLAAFFASFPGLEASFTIKKKESVQKGWVEICIFTKKRYYYPDFSEMKGYQQEFFSHFGDEYRKLDAEERKEFKRELYEKHPEIKSLNSKAGKLKGKLERMALNYGIQGSSSSMVKLAAIFIEEGNYSLDIGVLLMIHDELLTQYLEDEIEEKNKFVEEQMKEAGKYFTTELNMSATGAPGDCWIH